MPWAVGHFPCIMPKGLYLWTRRRALVGAEALACAQGITKGVQKTYGMDSLSAAALRDFVGNAYSLPIVLLIYIGALGENF